MYTEYRRRCTWRGTRASLTPVMRFSGQQTDDVSVFNLATLVILKILKQEHYRGKQPANWSRMG